MKTFFTSLSVFLVFLASLALMLFLILVDTSPMSKTEYLLQVGKFSLFRYAGVGSLDDREIELIYKGACTRKCHSRDVVERSAHTAREWEDIINRMGGINGASITKSEIMVITPYLAKRYGSNIPTVLSEQGGKYLKKHLWRSDFGESDLYVDLIYTPLEYFKVVGGSSKVGAYEAGDHLIFKVYLNTHQNKLDVYPLDKLAVLKTDDGKKIRPLLWKVVYDSSDFHHREGLLVFNKTGGDATSITVALNDLPGQKERLFQWRLPIPGTP